MEIYLNQLLDPIRKEFETSENKKLTASAYPPIKSKFMIYLYLWEESLIFQKFFRQLNFFEFLILVM